jgi:nickel/cobalt transporter (NicO) family protein
VNLYDAQRWIYATLGANLSGFANTRNWTALLSVLPLGILFGAIHALTPDHGTSVLASYLVGSRLAIAHVEAVAQGQTPMRLWDD